MNWKNPFLHCRSKNGFTLLEVIISLALLSIVMISLMVEKNRAFQQGVATHHYRQALQLGYQKMAEIQKGIELLQEGTFEKAEGFAWRVKSEELTVDTQRGPVVMTKLTLEIDYPSEEGQSTLHLVALGPPAAG